MIKIGIIDESLEAQSNTNIKELDDFNLVFNYPNINEFYKNKNSSAKIIIVDLEFIKSEHLNKIKELLDYNKADFCIALYSFEKRDLIEKLETNFCKPVKKPMTLRLLKVYLLLALKKLNDLNQNKILNKTKDNKNFSENKEEVKNKIKLIVNDLSNLEECSNILNNSNNENKINYDFIKLEAIRSRIILENTINKINI